ncbi:hypothetical protein [Streptomyces sp. NPDC051561]|uniref:hypothetical protein n=1 Tax=Streptomyces sp. NPDC051561 TaxID=3365658 RepID=UPI0037A74329
MAGRGRTAVGTLGVVLMGVGAVLVLGTGDVVGVALWLGGAIVAHDALIAPVVLGVGLLLGGLRAYGVVRGALLVAGCLTLVALPVLMRRGTPANSSVLPLDYVQGWLIAVAAAALGAGAFQAVRKLMARWGKGERSEPAG